MYDRFSACLLSFWYHYCITLWAVMAMSIKHSLPAVSVALCGSDNCVLRFGPKLAVHIPESSLSDEPLPSFPY